MQRKNNFLNPTEKDELKVLHKSFKDKKIADRIKCILLLDNGYSEDEIKQILLMSIRSIKRYKEIYRLNGVVELLTLNYKAYSGKLSKEQEKELKEHIRNNIFKTSKQIAKYIENHFNIKYTQGGMVITLHRLGFVYKKLKQSPGKIPDEEKQKEFVDEYEELKASLKPNEKIYFLDAVHPVHNTRPCYCWVEKGKDKTIKSNTGRKRVNINGLYSPSDNEIIYREDETINTQSTIALLEKAEKIHPELSRIYIIRDNAKYYSNKLVREYLETSKIRMKPLPSYCPNLNLIERLWKLLKKEVIDGEYYEYYEDFREAIRKFLLKDIPDIENKLNSLMTEKFQIIKNPG